jgi:hypothetical protein
MVAREAEANRDGSAELVRGHPDKLLAEVRKVTEGPTLFAPSHHPVLPADVNLERLRRIVRVAHERHPDDFEALLGTPGVGPATVRSLSLLAEVIYSAPASHRDPAGAPPPRPRSERPGRTATAPPSSAEPDPPSGERKWADYSYAHGGKDGVPFPVDRETYDRSIQILLDAVRAARVGRTEKADALQRLARIGGDL